MCVYTSLSLSLTLHIYIYIYICVCMCVYVYIYIYKLLSVNPQTHMRTWISEALTHGFFRNKVPERETIPCYDIT